MLNEETMTYWMNSTSEDLNEFKLIGTLLGLAIYNSVILDIRFPVAFYKKIMNVPLSMDDLKDIEPVGSFLSQALLLPNGVESLEWTHLATVLLRQ